MHWMGVTPPPTSRIAPSGHNGRSSKSTMACWITWALVNSQRKPQSLEKHMSAQYRRCTKPALSMEHFTYCSPRRRNQKQRSQQVMRSVSLDETTLSSDDMAKCPVPHTWAPCALRNGTETSGIRVASRIDVIESHAKHLPRDGRLFVSP